MVSDENRLPALIRTVAGTGPDPLDRLEQACTTADELGTVADLLINHFVVQARDAGLSWTQIGGRMGVTKQAARKRFLPPPDIPDEPAARTERLYGRYTESAKRTVALAQRLAQEHHHHYIGPEHLLLALCVQKEAGPDPEALADAVRRRLLPPSAEVPERPPFTEKGKKVLILAAQHAKRRGNDWIGTEHLLLGLAEQPSIAADALAER